MIAIRRQFHPEQGRQRKYVVMITTLALIDVWSRQQVFISDFFARQDNVDGINKLSTRAVVKRVDPERFSMMKADRCQGNLGGIQIVLSH